MDYDSTYTAPFGYQYSFAKPDDFVRTAALCSDEYFSTPINNYSDEAGRWYCDLTQIYVQYISSDSAFGSDLSKWPTTFTRYVETALALRAAPKIAKGMIDVLQRQKRSASRMQKSKDAMEQPPRGRQPGGWVRSRMKSKSSYDKA